MTAFARTSLLLFILLLLPFTAQAQSSPPQPAQSDQQLLKPEELDALLAPIALYPDALLAQILMASTYPLEVIEAERWITTNKNLKDDALKAAVDKQSWDDSVKSLVATPSVLDMMSDKLDWTQKLGDAVLAQQPDVMDAIQRLRQKAQANDKLTSNQQQNVSTEQQDGKQVIVITPAQPNTVYVPYYNPAVVYGPWPSPAYPPYYWPPPAYIGAGILATGLAFGAGYALGRWAGGGYWGGGMNWGGNNININRNVNINNINRGGGNNWVHNPAHRQGVRYANANVAQKFGGNRNAVAGGAQNRLDFRGRGGNQVLQPGGGGANRPNIGGGGDNRPNIGGGGNRPGGGAGGNRPSGGGGGIAGGNRPGGAGNRPGGGGNRPSASGGRGPGNAMGNVSSGRVANLEGARGRASLGGGGGGGPRAGGGGGLRGGGGGGGMRAGGGGGRGGGGGGRGGGGRRSDMRLKHDIVLLGRIDDGLGFYRFTYNGGRTAYVGVMAQEVRSLMPEAVVRGRDGYLRVFYDKLGFTFQTYDAWIASGARIPAVTVIAH
jgi:uncharacterized protein DUF3300/endosialidase-like protein